MRIVDDHSPFPMLARTVLNAESLRASQLTSDGGDVRVVLIPSRDRDDLGSILGTRGVQGLRPEVELSGAAALGAPLR